MTHTSTPTITGASAQTLDFIRHFARTCKPQQRIGKYIILSYSEEHKSLDEC